MSGRPEPNLPRSAATYARASHPALSTALRGAERGPERIGSDAAEDRLCAVEQAAAFPGGDSGRGEHTLSKVAFHVAPPVPNQVIRATASAPGVSSRTVLLRGPGPRPPALTPGSALPLPLCPALAVHRALTMGP